MLAHHALFAIGVAALVAGCGSPTGGTAVPSTSESPVATAPATQIPSASPAPTLIAVETSQPATAEPGDSAWAQHPPMPLLMSAAVRVAIPQLNVRERPTMSARTVGTLTPDNVLFIDAASPVEADGYIWYSGRVVSGTGEVPPLSEEPDGAGEIIAGWFAATRGATAYVTLVAPRCPDVVSLASVQAMLAAERLACFGDQSIELEGTFGCLGCSVEITGRYEPAWLAYPRPDLLWGDWMEDLHPLRIRFSPAGVAPPEHGSIIRVRGHFGDDVAAQCSVATFYPWERMDDEPAIHGVADVVAQEWCRQEFIVESYQVVGRINLGGV